ncbi:hypothetical protein N7490_006416 [Penicillium lividum]|nr:hypothetical protein N7490_006416 [Penicillium lividum]
MALLDLPNELLQAITQILESQRDINALAQTNCRLYFLLNPYLYSSNVRHHNSSALVWAAEHGQLQTAQKLICQGVDVQYHTNLGLVPLNLAVFNGHEAVTRLLLAYGADPEKKGLFGRTPLHEAARCGHEALVRLLMAQGVDLEPEDSDGRTPLHVAAYGGHEAVTKLLLEKDVDLQMMDSKDLLGCTPLLYAAQGGHEAVVIHLLAKWVSLESRDSYGRTPLHLAICNNHEAVARLLIESGGNMKLETQMIPRPWYHWLGYGYEAKASQLQVNDFGLESKNPQYMEQHAIAL